jgi:hypothetical protein
MLLQKTPPNNDQWSGSNGSTGNNTIPFNVAAKQTGLSSGCYNRYGWGSSSTTYFGSSLDGTLCMMYQASKSSKFSGTGITLDHVVAPARLVNGGQDGIATYQGTAYSPWSKCVNTEANEVSDSVSSEIRNFWEMSSVEVCKLADDGFNLDEANNGWGSGSPYGWWLRSPGKSGYYTMGGYVDANSATVYSDGSSTPVYINNSYAARPAFFINLSSLQKTPETNPEQDTTGGADNSSESGRAVLANELENTGTSPGLVLLLLLLLFTAGGVTVVGRKR